MPTASAPCPGSASPRALAGAAVTVEDPNATTAALTAPARELVTRVQAAGSTAVLVTRNGVPVGSPRAHRPDPPHGLRDPQSAHRSDRDPARAAHRRKRRRRPPGRIPRRHRRGPLRPASPPEGRPPPAPDRHPPARRGGRWRRERRTRAGRGRYRGRHGPSRRRPHRRRRRRRHRPRCPGHRSSRAPTVTSCPSVVTQNLVITGTVVAVLVTIDFIGHLPLPLGRSATRGPPRSSD